MGIYCSDKYEQVFQTSKTRNSKAEQKEVDSKSQERVPVKDRTIPRKKNKKSAGKSKKPYYVTFHEGKDGVPIKTLRCVKCSSFVVLGSSGGDKTKPKKHRASEHSVQKEKSKTGRTTKSFPDVDQSTEPLKYFMNPNNEQNYLLKERPSEQNIHLPETCEQLPVPDKYYPRECWKTVQTESNSDSQVNLGQISTESVMLDNEYVIFNSPNMEIIEENDKSSENG
ncbi:hypothetical protein JTB14_033840 [Gonioctena quinquepunctata]|nr:hypothetical protein JTB14_033840 [Gonioctena quinquepunctata]